MINNVYWVGKLGQIGGIETFIYELAKQFKDYDLVIYYKDIEKNQLERLKQFVKCIKYNGETINCKKFFCNYDISIIDNVEADEYIQIVHCVFSHNKLKPHTHDKITKYYAVGQEACDSFKQITNKECEVLHNLLNIEEPKRVLKLISATRLASDKGKLAERMQKLADELEANDIPFIWLVFTNGGHLIENKNVVYLEPRLDIRNYIASSDYLVQLSDTEAFCYSVLESLYLNIPVIVTDIPCFQEMHVRNEINGYIVDFDMKDIPIYNIYNNIPKFKYEKFKNEWDNMIIKEKSTYEKEKEMKVKVKCTKLKGYDDIQLKRHIEYNEEYIVEKERADYLKQHNAIEILEEIQEEKKDVQIVNKKDKQENKNYKVKNRKTSRK